MKTLFTMLAVLALASLALAQGSIRIDGSSTVYPISLAVAEEFQIENPAVQVTVSFSGTGGGFSKFCQGETDVNDASRVVKDSEIAECEANGIEMIEIPVAFDALTVAVNPENDFVQCLTTAELRMIFEPNSAVTTWSDVRPEWPNRELSFYIPGTDSGTFDYFTEAIAGESGATRTDVFPSEDDNVLIGGISGEQDAIGYFGFAYFVENQSAVNAVAVDNGDGCVEPSAENVENGTYSPLSRPLFIYVSVSAADEHDALGDFIAFYLSDDARELVADTGYITLSDAAYEAGLSRFEQRVSGSAFADFEPGGSVIETVRQGVE